MAGSTAVLALVTYTNAANVEEKADRPLVLCHDLMYLKSLKRYRVGEWDDAGNGV